MILLPSVRAKLEERFIFNFRMPLESMARFLPVPWLAPQAVKGFGVASYCILDLRNITVAPLPTMLGLSSVSCAPRYAVMDTSGHVPKTAVFVTERQTNSVFGSWFTTLGFSAPHPHVKASIKHIDDHMSIRVDGSESDTLFAASVRQTQEAHSKLFASSDDFAAFIAAGVSSYGLSICGDRLTKMDLHKQDSFYERLEVMSMRSPLTEEWENSGATFDSAFRTSGGLYEWTYLGLTD